MLYKKCYSHHRSLRHRQQRQLIHHHSWKVSQTIRRTWQSVWPTSKYPYAILGNILLEHWLRVSVRTHIGSGLQPRSIYITGQSFVVETYINVRWPWLALLFGLIAASVLFLLGTILKTDRSRVDVMKSNPLAAITILSSDARSYMGPTGMQDDMAKKADELVLRLSKDDRGWNLKPVAYWDGRLLAQVIDCVAIFRNIIVVNSHHGLPL